MSPISRCDWVRGQSDNYIRYHDEEWGAPVHDDHILFEFITLEGAQAGLSWATILKRRDGYRDLFKQFDPAVVASMTIADVDRLAEDERIIRHRGKIESTVTNAQNFLKIQEEFGSFDQYIWGFTDHKPIINHWENVKEVPSSTKLSDIISKDLKKRGFRYTGSTIVYAFMQACGLVNDHTKNCFRYSELV